MKMTVCCLLVFSLSVQADTAKKFKGFEQLVGHCWQATFPDGLKVDTHCFSDVYSGAFIKDQHVVCGEGQPYLGETWYVFGHNNNQVSYRYYNSMGGVSDGSVEYKDNQLLFPDETYEKNGQQIVYRSNWALSEDQYQSQMWQMDAKVESGWKKIWEMTFKKIELNKQNVAQYNEKHQLTCYQD
ncbi:MAG: hypothetical protein R3E90_05630 [Marinicella sp.]|nr:hypothetical protein [Xanthomonadales bacterium]